ncbi:MAG: hypothetical protein ACYDIC_14565 [Desulfobaccales bacterium]
MWLRFLGVIAALLALGLGCAAGEYRPQKPDAYYPSITDVDPSFYEGDPNLRYWFTAPYWNPSIGE